MDLLFTVKPSEAGTPQDDIYELINGKFIEPTSYFKNAIMNDYWNTEPTSSSKSMDDGFNVKKISFK